MATSATEVAPSERGKKHKKKVGKGASTSTEPATMDGTLKGTLSNAARTVPPRESSTSAQPSANKSRGRGRGRGTPVNLADIPDAAPSPSRGRGNRGGLGKYLRARGRGRGFGRPAEFGQRLLLPGEKHRVYDDNIDENEEQKAEREQNERKYSRRQMSTNAERYKEEQVELGEDGKPILPPEVDLSLFLERQRITGPASLPDGKPQEDDEDVDYSLAHISSKGLGDPSASKGKSEEIEWDDEMEQMMLEKTAADANRELTSRFRAKSERLRKKPVAPTARERKIEASYVSAPALPTDGHPKDVREEMEDFLDDLLT